MMEKAEHIVYWRSGAERDWDTAEFMASSGRHVPALFFYQLAVEKWLKAHWVKDNVGNTPPLSHDLKKLATATALPLDAIQFDYLDNIASWNIETRYPDFKDTLYRLADTVYITYHRQKLSALRKWLEQQF